MKRLTPLDAVARGLAAGVVGTSVVTAWQELSSKLQADEASAADSAQRSDDPWEQAAAPAQVAKRVSEGVFQRKSQPRASRC